MCAGGSSREIINEQVSKHCTQVYVGEDGGVVEV